MHARKVGLEIVKRSLGNADLRAPNIARRLFLPYDSFYYIASHIKFTYQIPDIHRNTNTKRQKMVA